MNERVAAKQLYLRPTSVEEALALADEYGASGRFIAGGTDLLPNKFTGTVKARCLIDLSGVKELKDVYRNGKHLRIGSGICLDDLSRLPDIQGTFPVLPVVAGVVASPVIRKTATLGGNLLCENRCTFYNQSEWWREAAGLCLKCDGDICIATGGKRNCFSKFSSDMAVVLISMNAFAEVAERGKGYTVHLEDIYTGDGLSAHRIHSSSIIKSVHIPLHENYRTAFRKLRKRESLDFGSLLCVATVNKYGRVKVVAGGVDPGPVVAEGSHTDSPEKFTKAILRMARTVDNDVFSREYRREMIGVSVESCLKEIEFDRAPEP